MLLGLIARLHPKYLIIDTCLSTSQEAIIEIRTESSPAGFLGQLAGFPSRGALERMLANCGFQFQYLNWRALGIQDWTGIEEHRDGARVTLRADFCG